MFESLSDRLGGVFDRLTKQGALSEADVEAALREVRTALLEADVSLPVARDFIKKVTARATGDLLRSRGFRQIHELDWGQTVTLTVRGRALTVTAIEVAHWGARMMRDDHRGYNGYVLEREGAAVCFAGDTAYTEVFARLRSRARPIDLMGTMEGQALVAQEDTPLALQLSGTDVETAPTALLFWSWRIRRSIRPSFASDSNAWVTALIPPATVLRRFRKSSRVTMPWC